jgi:hypothetical protein
MEMLALILGTFGHVAFFADFGRAVVPVWPRVGAHVAVVFALIFLEPLADTPRPRPGSLAVTLAASLYVGQTLASFALVAAGVRMPGLTFYLVLASPGSLLAASILARAVRSLSPSRPPAPPPLYAPPWAGAYRTRPGVPPAPVPRPVPAPPSPRRDAIGLALLSTAFAAAGAFLLFRSKQPHDEFWGLNSVALFGLGAWVFWEQVAAGTGALPPQAQRRAQVGLVIAGAIMLMASLTSPYIDLLHRVMFGGIGALLVPFALAALWKNARAGRRRGGR